MKGTGESILEETMMVPLGADPVQMRREQEAAQAQGEEDGEGCDTPGMKKRSKGKGRGLARGKGKGPMGVPAGEEEGDESREDGESKEDEETVTIPMAALKTFKTFYVEGHPSVAADLLADALDIKENEKLAEGLDEAWEKFLVEGEAAQLNFLRKTITKFSTFLSTAKNAWDKLSDSKKENAVKFLQSKAQRMATEIKTKANNMSKDSPADEILGLMTLAYFYGMGTPGEGAAAAESEE